jgi:hypothetical protein
MPGPKRLEAKSSTVAAGSTSEGPPLSGSVPLVVGVAEICSCSVPLTVGGSPWSSGLWSSTPI